MFPARLSEGYRQFLGGAFRREQERYQNLAETGQTPEILIISCCDSRVSPEIIFDARPGELFVVRNVANLVPPYEIDDNFHGTSAALEFAVLALQVRHIVVLGHARCGGIRAFAEQSPPISSGNFIGKWMSIVAPAADSLNRTALGHRHLDGAAYTAALELAGIEQSLKNLLSFNWIAERVEQENLMLHGAYFDIATGQLLLRDTAGQFVPA